MIKHPTLSARQIEKLQGWCFQQDFETLGPTIIRVQETRLLGYQKLKNSANPVLCAKADAYAREMRGAYPVYLPGKLLGPNAKVRRWIRDLEKRVHAELGGPTLTERLQSVPAVGAALWMGLALKLDLFQHPTLM